MCESYAQTINSRKIDINFQNKRDMERMQDQCLIYQIPNGCTIGQTEVYEALISKPHFLCILIDNTKIIQVMLQKWKNNAWYL